MSKAGITDDMRVVPPAGYSPDDRMPVIAEADMTPEQRAAVAAFREKRGQEPGGPFVPLVRSPAVLSAATNLGAYLRFESALAIDGSYDIDGLVIYKDTGNSATSPLIAYIDESADPKTPNDSDVNITWDDGVNKIFAI